MLSVNLTNRLCVTSHQSNYSDMRLTHAHAYFSTSICVMLFILLGLIKLQYIILSSLCKTSLFVALIKLSYDKCIFTKSFDNSMCLCLIFFQIFVQIKKLLENVEIDTKPKLKLSKRKKNWEKSFVEIVFFFHSSFGLGCIQDILSSIGG